jgi:hypothetical protein
MYDMVFRKLSETRAEMHLSWIRKGIIILMALFLFGVAFSSLPRILWIALALAIISLAAGLYRESWIFIRSEENRDELTLTRLVGIWPLHKKRIYSIGKVTAIKVYTPRSTIQKHLATEARSWGYHRLAHSFDKSITKVEMYTRDDGKIVLYADTTKKVQLLISLADQLSAFLNVQREILEQ